jgi:hypothetical protein
MRKVQSFIVLTLIAAGCGSSSSSSDAAVSEAGAVIEAGALADASAAAFEAGRTSTDVAGPVSEAGSSVVDVAGPVSEAGASVVDAAATSEAGGSALDGSTAGGVATAYCTSKLALGSMPDLSGTWVAKLTGAQIVSSPLTKAMHNQNVYYQVFTIQQTGSSITIDGHYCDRTEINDASAIVPVAIPNAWAYTETAIHRTGEIAASGAGYPILKLPALFEAIGAHLASSSDALPTDAADLRVYDQDNDGQPGITIRLSGLVTGSVYSVQSQTTAVSAVAVSSTRLEGAMTFTSNQNVLASDPSTIKTLYSSSTTGPDSAVCASTFVMVKITAADVPNCAVVRAQELALFK